MSKKAILISGISAIVIALVVLVLILVNYYKGDTVKEDLLGIDYNEKGNTATLNYDTKNPVVALYIKNYGSVVIELYPKIAPNTVNNFIYLVKKGFYDDNTFHRLMENFVLQGGDPTGTGSGGPGYSIKGEFTNNGFKNDLRHTKKVVSMARATENDTAGSQFFIMLEDNSDLDGNYASFGKVIDGWNNVERIASNEIVSDKQSGKLNKNLTIKKALVDTKGKDYKEPKKITS